MTIGMFDFVTSDELRASLLSDYSELNSCMERKAWKAVHVLAGSIIEAVLVDYLLASDYQKRTKQDPLKMEFAALIKACRAEGVLSERTEQLSHVLRGYRNLIHPDRQVRLGDPIDGNTATVAHAIISMIALEVSTNRSRSYGYTAEQILTKVEADPGSVDVLHHLLADTKEVEKERLLRSVLPGRYMLVVDQNPFEAVFPIEQATDCLSKAYRKVFESASEKTRRSALSEYIRLLKEGSGDTIRNFDAAFLWGEDLDYVKDGDLQLVKDHLFSALKKEDVWKLSPALDGIAKHSTDVEFKRLAGQLLRRSSTVENRSSCHELLVGLWANAPALRQRMVEEQVVAFVNRAERYEHLAEWTRFLRELHSALTDVPF